jgi:hypothetical protein
MAYKISKMEIFGQFNHTVDQKKLNKKIVKWYKLSVNDTYEIKYEGKSMRFRTKSVVKSDYKPNGISYKHIVYENVDHIDENYYNNIQNYKIVDTIYQYDDYSIIERESKNKKNCVVK